MQFTNFISISLPLLFAAGAVAQDGTSVSTYYTTKTVERVVATTTCTSTTTPTISSTSSSSTSTLMSQVVQPLTMSTAASAPVWVPSASAGLPMPSNGTNVTAPTMSPVPYTGAASGMAVQYGAAAFAAAIIGAAQLL